MPGRGRVRRIVLSCFCAHFFDDYIGPGGTVRIPASVMSIGKGTFYDTPFTGVSLGANVILGSFAFPRDLDTVYNNGGKLAGTYIRDANDAWKRQP